MAKTRTREEAIEIAKHPMNKDKVFLYEGSLFGVIKTSVEGKLFMVKRSGKGFRVVKEILL